MWDHSLVRKAVGTATRTFSAFNAQYSAHPIWWIRGRTATRRTLTGEISSGAPLRTAPLQSMGSDRQSHVDPSAGVRGLGLSYVVGCPLMRSILRMPPMTRIPACRIQWFTGAVYFSSSLVTG